MTQIKALIVTDGNCLAFVRLIVGISLYAYIRRVDVLACPLQAGRWMLLSKIN